MLGDPVTGNGVRLYRCTLHDSTTTLHTRCPKADRHCPTCADHAPVVTFNEANLAIGRPGYRFNASIIRYPERPGPKDRRLVFSWRDGWSGSNIWVCFLDEHLRPASDAVPLVINHPDASYGREDPTLFEFGGRLHVAFVGVVWVRGQLRTHQLYARLTDEFRVEQVFSPRAPGTAEGTWEKNWQFFESERAGPKDRRLYAVYFPRPHRVLALDGERTEWVGETPGLVGWRGGEPRGGTSPVLVNGEFWSFFHDSTYIHDRKTYRVGLYTFSPEPPFAIRRFTPEPIYVADKATNTHGNYCDCIFPRGAVWQDQRWLLASGVHDRWAEIRTFAHTELERRLVKV
jgi:predicted GH43/DUF377 family glycosyl hydrolase